MNVNGESEDIQLNYGILGMVFRTPIKAKGPDRKAACGRKFRSKKLRGIQKIVGKRKDEVIQAVARPASASDGAIRKV